MVHKGCIHPTLTLVLQHPKGEKILPFVQKLLSVIGTLEREDSESV